MIKYYSLTQDIFRPHICAVMPDGLFVRCLIVSEVVTLSVGINSDELRNYEQWPLPISKNEFEETFEKAIQMVKDKLDKISDYEKAF